MAPTGRWGGPGHETAAETRKGPQRQTPSRRRACLQLVRASQRAGPAVDASWAQGHSDQLRPRPAGRCSPLPAVKWRTVKRSRGQDGAGTSLNTGPTPGDSGPASEKSLAWRGGGTAPSPAWVSGLWRAPRPPGSYSCRFLAASATPAPASVWVGPHLATRGGEEPLLGQHTEDGGLRRQVKATLRCQSQWKIWLSPPLRGTFWVPLAPGWALGFWEPLPWQGPHRADGRVWLRSLSGGGRSL